MTARSQTAPTIDTVFRCIVRSDHYYRPDRRDRRRLPSHQIALGETMKRLFTVGVLLCAILLCATAIAQTTNATLGGTVSDTSRALIPGVSVTATNTQTGIVTTVVTNETGAYQFASLQTGLYKVTAELPGFQTQTYNDVSLGVSQQVRLNFTLQVSVQAQSVEVSVAADTLIATTSSSVGAVLPEYNVRDLPLATRNVLDLIGTTSGTQ